jgi:hypothetical protein
MTSGILTRGLKLTWNHFCESKSMIVRQLSWAAIGAVMVCSSAASAFAALSVNVTGYTAGVGSTTLTVGNTTPPAGTSSATTANGGIIQMNQSTGFATEPLLIGSTGLWNGGTTYNTTGGFLAVCIEITQDVFVPSTGNQYTAALLQNAPQPAFLQGSPMGTTAALAIARLWAFKMHDIVAGTATSGVTGYLTQAGHNSTFLGAFQLAVWELVYDQGNFNLLAGNSTASSDTTAEAKIAKDWIASLAINNIQPANVVALTGGAGNLQDMVVEVGPGGADLLPVPEPASFAVWAGLGMVGLAFGWRQRKS